jgi:tRNA 2-selenouridine synthase
MNSSLPINEFIQLAKEFPVIDVRSPGEFEQGHIPGAINIPLFDNDERAIVGTAYVQISRKEAIKIGYELANPKIKSFIAQIREIIKPLAISHQSLPILIHCWRGGMRSSKFAQLLNEHGHKTHTLTNGYKAYRNFVIESFTNKAEIIILGGKTGSGKTEILRNIAAMGEQVIDLEAIAHHKGSAFGALGEKPQPTYEQFENELSYAFSKVDLSKRIWLEDESRNIGRTQIPPALWEKMKLAPILRINVPKKLRIERLLKDYGSFSKEELKGSILKIQQRLGPQHVKHALEELENGSLYEVADVILTYYDKAYNYNHEKRDMKDVFFVESKTSDASKNASKIMEFVINKNFKNYA